MFVMFWAWMPQCDHVFLVLIIIATLWVCTFPLNVHSKQMYIWHIIDHVCHILCIIATLWPCLPHFDYDCHSVGMFATFWVLLPHCSNVCHVLIMIATPGMFATFWLLLPQCGHVCQILITIATMWACTFALNVHSKWMYIWHIIFATFDYDIHSVSMLGTFWLWLTLDCHIVAMFAKFWLWLPHCGHLNLRQMYNQP